MEQAGWSCLGKSDKKQVFTDFVKAREFSRKREEAISYPAQNVHYDMKLVDSTGQDVQTQINHSIRRAVIGFFRLKFPDEKCIWLDINHPSYEFTPSKLSSSESLEPWPVPLIPLVDFIVVSDRSFSQGLFANPKKTKLVVFGSDFVNWMLEKFPLIPTEIAN